MFMVRTWLPLSFISRYHKGVKPPRLVLNKTELLQYFDGLLCTLPVVYSVTSYDYYGKYLLPFFLYLRK